jgi:vesicle coat complex subunit
MDRYLESWLRLLENVPSEFLGILSFNRDEWLTKHAVFRRWGQVYILDALMSFTPQTATEAEQLGERISIRLQHANSAVVLTTIKVLLYLMNYMEDDSLISSLERKMGPPLGQY